MLRNLASGYRGSTVVPVIGIAINIVPGIRVAAAGNYELTLLSRTITSAAQNTSIHREISASPHEWLHVINVEVLPGIPMHKTALFTQVVRRAAAKVIPPCGKHPILPITVQDLLALGVGKRNTGWGCHHDLLVGDRQCTPDRPLSQSCSDADPAATRCVSAT